MGTPDLHVQHSHALTDLITLFLQRYRVSFVVDAQAKQADTPASYCHHLTARVWRGHELSQCEEEQDNPTHPRRRCGNAGLKLRLCLSIWLDPGQRCRKEISSKEKPVGRTKP